VVHRDVKPGNVLLTADGDIKVTDFGIARAGTSEALTQTGAVMGTAAYFSPEQAQGLPVDGRSDVYSLGVVLYEMVTGAPPFTGESPVAVAYKHVREDPEPPAARAPDLPPDLEHIILTAMAKDADSRYQTADELRADLTRFVRGQPPLGGPVTGLVADGTATAAVAATQAAPMAALDGHDPDEHRKKRRGALVAGILGVVLIAAVIIALLASGGGGGGGPTAEVPNVINKPFAEADQALKLSGFKVSRKDVVGKDPPDIVLSQKPTGGEKFQKNGTVTLRVSKATFTMPALTGKQRTDAVNDLIAVGLQDPNNGIDNQEVDSDQPPGTVVGSNPAAGAQVPKAGQKVTLQIARQPSIAMPNVVGQESQTAQQLLQQAGFQVSVQSEQSDSVPTGRVTRTDPGANTQVKRGSSVTMFVSTGPQTVDVPNVVGQMQAQASQTLQQAGFQVFVSQQSTNNPTENGRVLAQNPAGGAQTTKGGGVTLTVGKFPP
jgi:serine/threonine-protein kinase